MTTDEELRRLRRCVELASEALEAGDEPFGSMLVAANGTVLAEDRNRVAFGGGPTRHPEFELARWAAANLTPAQRAAATVFTSREHCPMCAAAHGWVRLGHIMYAWCRQGPVRTQAHISRASWPGSCWPRWPTSACCTCTARRHRPSGAPADGQTTTSRLERSS